MPHVKSLWFSQEGGVAVSRAAVGTWELEPLHSMCGLCSLFPERDGGSGLDTLVGLRLGKELEPSILAV